MSARSRSHIYGGLDTMMSYFGVEGATHSLPLPKGGESSDSISYWWNDTLAPSRSAFASAIASASGDMSTASTSASGISNASVMAMQPLPVPISRIFRLSEGWVFIINRQSSSVSGRGMSTPVATEKLRPQKQARPSTYCIGSPSSRRAMARSICCRCASSRRSIPPAYRSASDSPASSSSSIRTTA